MLLFGPKAKWIGIAGWVLAVILLVSGQVVGQGANGSVGTNVLNEARLRGFELIQKGDWVAAGLMFDKVLALDPNDGPARYGKAVTLFNLKLVDEADILLLSLMEKKDPVPPNGLLADVLVLSAVIESVKGHNDAAVAKLGRAVTLVPKHFDANYSLARALYVSGDIVGSVKYFRESVAISPEHQKARFFLATALERAGDNDGAALEYREILRRDKKSFDGLLGLGILLIRTEGNSSAEGLKMLEAAVGANPADYEGRVALGKAYIRNGEWAKAVEHLSAAAALIEGNPEPHFQLAIAYRKLGRRAEAAAASERAKEIHERRRGVRNGTQ